MPPKGGGKKKKSNSPARKVNANKEDLEGLDELLADPELLRQFEDKTQPPVRKGAKADKSRTGVENARIGLEGFTQATRNPAMFAEAMTMLSDPNAVKEAQSMMEDPEFKREIQKHMASLKSDPSFQDAMVQAQKKFQELMKNPEQLEALQAQCQQLVASANTPEDGARAIEGGAAQGAVADPGIDDETAETAGVTASASS